MRRAIVISRRDFAGIGLGFGAALLSRSRAMAQPAPLMTRPIPRSGEAIPVVGLGTARVFDRADENTRGKARAVVQALVAGGGRLIDTASVYGDAETVLGAVMSATGLQDQFFIATKLESANAAELKRSLARLKRDKLDLLQLHNINQRKQSLAKFREWKARGVCRYIGITSTYHADFGAVEAALRREKPDFVQVDYSLDNRVVERRILPLAMDMQVGVLTAEPLGYNRLFRAVRGKALPEWAAEFDANSWAQFFLKYLIGNPAVTAVIPGTGNPAHMSDNLGAGRGRLPDAVQRRRMVEYIESL